MPVQTWKLCTGWCHVTDVFLDLVLWVSAGDEQPAVHPGECGHTRSALSECEVYPSGGTLLPSCLQHQLQGMRFSSDWSISYPIDGPIPADFGKGVGYSAGGGFKPTCQPMLPMLTNGSSISFDVCCFSTGHSGHIGGLAHWPYTEAVCHSASFWSVSYKHSKIFNVWLDVKIVNISVLSAGNKVGLTFYIHLIHWVNVLCSPHTLSLSGNLANLLYIYVWRWLD